MRQRRFLKPRLAGALSALLLIGGSLAQWSPVGAQTMPTTLQTAVTGPTAPDSGFTVVQPTMRTYYQQHGGVRTLGKPLSQDFQLVGRRVQIFEQQVLEQRQDGSVHGLDLLSDALPLTHAAGETFPTADPDMLAGTPPLESASYQAQALAAIDDGLLDWATPDDFNGIPVSFGSTFRNTVSCNDLPTGQPCDDRRLLSGALDVWGLPVSAPTVDPGNPDLVYLRFQRGIMQYSQSTGQTQGVPLGSWFKRVLIGTDLPDDLLSDVLGSRYFAQYAPTLPLGVARASELPATSLAVAFNASTTTSFLSPGLATDATATPVAPALAPAFPSFGATSTPSALSGSLTGTLPGTSPTDPSFALTPSASPTLSGTPSAALAGSTTPGAVASLTTTPGVSTGVSSTTALPNAPQGPDPCTGDEQILFSPKKPYVGTDVLVAVTSATHHDVRAVRLTGPVKSGQVTERAGLEGWVWEWTISPTIDGWYEFTFFTDGARACATSGFNALPSFGATSVPAITTTPTLFPTVTPIPSATTIPTATPIPAPALAATGAAEPACGGAPGSLLHLTGTNFGISQGTVSGTVLFSSSTGSGAAAAQATIYSWTNTNILLTIPSSLTPGPYDIVVITASGSSNPVTYKVGVGGCS